ncbi:SDR family NAD(P)-dependent oxidoreductase [Cryobacterium tagatosivorans]|uniref:SDR family oxidoreductase n=1 Tax=Cryobacterium tagatosivorans TaxID=1259199 RepID=A0A4R8UBF6_9MICO|nr:SDR family oxidoreductase [Cryobacterium tagatosivorans]TFB47808.1 SDR family oxidoreductase [Cryobacterium tagatosivorans]
MVSASRVALVTGAASGIGAAVARRLARDGIAVICADIENDGAESVASAIRAAGGQAEALALDITNDAQVSDVQRSILAGFGRLDILVNNAGIGGEIDIADVDRATVRRVLSVNLEGAIALTLAVRTMLIASDAGRILNIASIQGFLGARNSLAYGASKGGLVNFTRGLACDLADDNVLVNALAPGFVDTPMARFADGSTEYDTDWFRDIYVEGGRIPLRRPAAASEVAEAAVFFCSAANTYVTGQVLAVDGGLTATF